MTSRWRSVLSVFLATCVVVAGVVIIAVNHRTGPASGASPGDRYATTAHRGPAGLVPLPASSFPSTIRTSKPRPTLTVDTGCHPGIGPARLPDVPPDLAQRVNAAWERIELWLAGHAPATAATLAAPAPAERISSVQWDIGVPLPADLVASLRRHDGVLTGQRATFTLPPFFEPLSAADIRGESTMMCRVLSRGEEASVGSWWHGQFVPVAVDHGGDSLFYDQRGGAARFGRHYNEDTVSFDRMPASLTELLEQTAETLEGKRPALDHSRPVVTPEGALDWEYVR